MSFISDQLGDPYGPEFDEGYAEDESLRVEELEPVTQVVAEVAQFIEVCRTELNPFAALCAPETFEYEFPDTYLAIWQWLLSYADKWRVFPRLALGLPRGFSKTTLIQLFIAYCVVYTRRQYVIIFAALPDLAQKVLGGAMKMITSENFQRLYGQVVFEKETLDEVRFHFRGRLIVLQSRSAGTSIRGTNVEGLRPDLIIFDDIQKREDAKSPILFDALKDWFQNTALKLRSPKGCMYVFLGNMYPTEYSMLKWLIKQPAWVKFITGAILADGRSLWERLFPIQQLIEEFQADCAAGMRGSFMAELMNDGSAQVNMELDTTKLNPFTNLYNQVPEGKFIIIDPSSGRVGKDKVAIGYFEVHDEKPYLMRAVAEHLSPGDTITTALTMATETGTRLICIEGVAYQETLAYWFDKFARELGLHETLLVELLYPSKGSKNARIMDMFRAWMAQELGVGEEPWNDILSQATAFDPRDPNNTDDLLDLLQYAPKVVTTYRDVLAELQMQDINAIEPARQLPDYMLSPI